MDNTKDEVRSIDDLIGKLYDKIKQRDKQIKKLYDKIKQRDKQIKKLKKEIDTLRNRRFNVDGEKDDDVKKQALRKEIDMFMKAALAPRPSKFADDGYVDIMSL